MPGVTTFTTPPHPAHVDRDPHELPEFTDSTAELFYLPPLLSSLPANEQHPDDGTGLRTDTRLPDIDPVSLSLHRALHAFRPLTRKYASTPYKDAFNWAELSLPADEEREWYCVVFRSRRKPGSDGSPLYEADRLAHDEAVHNGGLLLYWYGVPDPESGLNTATCIWQSRKHAIAATSRPHHMRAMKLAAASYDVYSLERHVLRKRRGETGLHIEAYVSGDVGW
ncbi:hypothetical protein EXIGLDRAFT_834510 [Exidia glandulosa HHB12029]|uniref:Uncharacterized protein n=1 Tax=Exidia glandulosa HHB12029 TaxID=1314781 RepID=A0A165JP64_EXIGL|nr:hypothetical protein EXIGLDRAFT_834510 [Exidia glandulosa HHB12029]